MSRRRKVVLASAITLFALGALVVGGAVTATRTRWGREQIRQFVMTKVNAGFKGRGKLYLGPISGSLLSDVTVDSFSLAETNDSVFIATGRVHVKFDVRDLWDRRLLVREARVENPVIRLRQDSVGRWNYRTLFPSGPPGPKRTQRKFGDYIVLTNTAVRNLAFSVSTPWRPADSLSGTKRDSAITHGLTRPDKIIRRSGSNFTITRSWQNTNIDLSHGRIADPDSAGRLFVFSRLDSDEFDPPLQIRNAVGQVRILGDSLWPTISAFHLPGSVGSAQGKVWWGSDLPTRYDLTVRSDSMSLADVAWVYPTLPKSGGGRVTLKIHNQDDLRVIDYSLRDMDVRTTNSRLQGAMTFGVGGPVLQVNNLSLKATPIDWKLIEQFTGKPLPLPWRGAITASVAASGGPVNAFKIESGEFDFVDGNVRGATARGRVKGELDMLFPAFTKFHALQVELDHLDLATLQFLNPAFPRLDGVVAGRAILDSLWLDVRFREADVTHRFGEEGVSRATGSGRATIGDSLITWDIAMNAEPVDLTTIAHAWPELALEQRGAFTGPIRAQGTAADLAVATTLRGAAGEYGFDGRVDIDSVGGYAWDGTLRFANANLRTLYDTAAMPVTSLTGSAELKIVGDSLANYRGPLTLDLERSTIDSLRLSAGARALLRFDDGLLRVDTAFATTSLGTLATKGGLGMRADRQDSLFTWWQTSSLEGLRPWLLAAAANDSVAQRLAQEDSLAGDLTAQIVARGSIDTLGVELTLNGSGVSVGDTRARRLHSNIALANVTSSAINGAVKFVADSALAATLSMERGEIDAKVFRRDSTDAAVAVKLTNGPALDATLGVDLRKDSLRVGVRTLGVQVQDHVWSLLSPGQVSQANGGWLVDTLHLRGSTGGRVSVGGAIPASGDVSLGLQIDSMSMADLAAMAQLKAPLTGTVDMRIDARGTRAAPTMDISGTMTGTAVGDLKLARTKIAGRYQDRRLRGEVNVIRNDTVLVTLGANYPIDLALESRSRRLLEDTMRVSLRSRDVDLNFLESFTSTINNASGRLNADVAVTGRPSATSMDGYFRISRAGLRLPSAGITLRDMEVDIDAQRDTARIRRFSVTSGAGTKDTLGLSGWIARKDRDVAFDLRLRSSNFEATNTRRTRMSVSSDITLQGSQNVGSTLGGTLVINSGQITIPEVSQKNIVALDYESYVDAFDTTLAINRSAIPQPPPELAQRMSVRNLRIDMGPDVWLKSAEANIKLGGSVNVISGQRLVAGVPQLALEGALSTERGTFNLRLGGGVIQRLFTLEGGEIRFLGEPTLNPTLDIRALYTVRQATSLYRTSNDIRIRARLVGTREQTRIVVESADSLALTESDLYSYLVLGRPSADIGGLDYGFDFLLSSLSSGISARYSGRFFDFIQLQTAAGRQTNNNNTFGSAFNPRSILEGAQLGIGKQLNNRTFISLTAGLCRAINPSAGRIDQTIGLALEHRLPAGYGLSLSRDPPVEALLCQDPAALGFSSGRSQFGFDIFRAWRW